MPLYVRTLLITVAPDEARVAADAHRAHLRELHARGKLRAAGEFNDGDGFLDIFEAADLLEAQSVGGASPLISEGLATWMLRQWTELTFE